MAYQSFSSPWIGSSFKYSDTLFWIPHSQVQIKSIMYEIGKRRFLGHYTLISCYKGKAKAIELSSYQTQLKALRIMAGV